MSVNFRFDPEDDRIIYQPTQWEDKTAGGIVLPETAKTETCEGVVLAVGPGKIGPSGTRVPIDVQVGQTIVLKKHSSTKIKLDGIEVESVHEVDVLAVKEIASEDSSIVDGQAVC